MAFKICADCLEIWTHCKCPAGPTEVVRPSGALPKWQCPAHKGDRCCKKPYSCPYPWPALR